MLRSSEYRISLALQCSGTGNDDPWSGMRQDMQGLGLAKFLDTRCGKALEVAKRSPSKTPCLFWMGFGKYRSPADFQNPKRRSWSDAFEIKPWALHYWRDVQAICEDRNLKPGFYLPTLWLVEPSSDFRLNRARFASLLDLIALLGPNPWVAFDALHGASVASPARAAQPAGSLGDGIVRTLIGLGVDVDGEPQPRTDTAWMDVGTLQTQQVRNAALGVQGADLYNLADALVQKLPRRWLWVNEVDPAYPSGPEGLIATIIGARAQGYCPMFDASLDFWNDSSFVNRILA